MGTLVATGFMRGGKALEGAEVVGTAGDAPLLGGLPQRHPGAGQGQAGRQDRDRRPGSRREGPAAGGGGGRARSRPRSRPPPPRPRPGWRRPRRWSPSAGRPPPSRRRPAGCRTRAPPSGSDASGGVPGLRRRALIRGSGKDRHHEGRDHRNRHHGDGRGAHAARRRGTRSPAGTGPRRTPGSSWTRARSGAPRPARRPRGPSTWSSWSGTRPRSSAALEGPDGLYAGARAGQIYVDMSTQLPATAVRRGGRVRSEAARPSWTPRCTAPGRVPLRRPLDHGRRRAGGLRPGPPALPGHRRDRPLHGRHRQGLRRQALRQPPGLDHPGRAGRVAGHGREGRAGRVRADRSSGASRTSARPSSAAPAARCSSTTSRSPSTSAPW